MFDRHVCVLTISSGAQLWHASVEETTQTSWSSTSTPSPSSSTTSTSRSTSTSRPASSSASTFGFCQNKHVFNILDCRANPQPISVATNFTCKYHKYTEEFKKYGSKKENQFKYVSNIIKLWLLWCINKHSQYNSKRCWFLLSSTGALRSLVTAFFSLAPLPISDSRAFLPCSSDFFKTGFSVFACEK